MTNAKTLPGHAYFEGKIVPFAEANVSIFTNALHYGTGAFGGIRAFWNEDEEQLFIFRPLDHFTRFLGSTRLLRMEFEHTPASLTEITRDLLRLEGWHENLYIRPLAYTADLTINVHLGHGMHGEVAIFAIPFGSYVPNEEGTSVTFSSWQRIDDNAIPARGKISGAYANTAFIKTDALDAGYDEALVLNRDGHLAEGSSANFMMVRDGVVVTPPITANILEGITRRTVMQLMREQMGLEVVERQIDRTEVYLAEEVFFCGTGVQIAAITSVDKMTVGDGKIGPIVSELRDLYFSVVTGRVEAYRHWCSPVYETVKA